MEKYIDIIKNSYSGYWNYLKNELISINHWDNYFYGLIIISLVVWGLEILFPWRKNQSVFRKDFWLDTFYMFFNFFILNLIILIALSNTAAQVLNDILGTIGLSVNSFQLFNVNALPNWLGLFVFFLVSDFVQWNTHRLLHRVPFLWNFHKVHHSVKEMGFAAHLRYHWMEPVVYKSLLYIPIAFIGNYQAKDIAIISFIFRKGRITKIKPQMKHPLLTLLLISVLSCGSSKQVAQNKTPEVNPVDLILRHYPTKSIKDIKKPWDQRYWKLGDKWYNLNEIEHEILRKMDEPRIHFAIVCASFSCPKLQNTAFEAADLDAQLTLATKTFINDPKRNTLTPNKIEISKIFSWFAKDFGGSGNIINYINKYADIKIPNNTSKRFKDYDWALND